MKSMELRLGGSGGQGLITAGIILAEASIMEGYNAIQSQSYGPEARGGASKAEVIISQDEVDYPKVGDADVLLALRQEAFDKYCSDMKTGGIILADESIATETGPKNSTVLKLPILKTAQDLRAPIVANIVAVGALCRLGELDKTTVKQAVLGRVPKAKAELNLEAFERGYNMIDKSMAEELTA